MGDKLEDEDWIKEGIEDNDSADWQEDEGESQDNDNDNDEDVSNEGEEDGEDEEEDDEKEPAELLKRKEEKKRKRKERLKEAKERKKRKLEAEVEQFQLPKDNNHDDDEEDDEDNEEEEEQQNKNKKKAKTSPASTLKKQLTVNEMNSLLEYHMPEDFKYNSLHANNQYDPLIHFFYPALDASQVTESLTKAPCPFIRGLSVAFPNYRKHLLEDISSSKTPSSSSSSTENNGAPLVLIVTASAHRATQIIKSISSKLISIKIGKLFAKHFKLVEQIEMLSKENYPIVIGTPNRLNKLIENGALSLHRVKIVLMDYTNDAKQFNLLTLPEVKNDFYEFFYNHVYKERDHLKIAMISDTYKDDDEEGEEGKKKGNGKGQMKKSHHQHGNQKKFFHFNNKKSQKNNSNRTGIQNKKAAN